MANLKIVAVTTDGGAQFDDYSVFINENVGTGTIIGEVTGWESTPNITFRAHQESGVDQDIGGRYHIVKIGEKYFLAVKSGGNQMFDYEDEVFGGAHQQMWFEAVNASGTVVHNAIYDVYLNDLEPEGGPVNQPPQAPTHGTVSSINENVAGSAGTVITTVTSQDDSVGGGSLSYKFAAGGNPGNLFSINSTTGVITFTGAAQDYETNPNLGSDQNGKFFTLTVLATDGPGLNSGTTTIKVYVNDVNEAPTDLAYATVNNVSENAAQGTVIATSPTVTDPDTNPAFRNYTYALVNADGSAYTGNNYQVNATTGVVTVGAGGLPDVSVPTQVSVYVRVSDGSGGSHREQVTFTVNPVSAPNQPPSAPEVQGTALSLTEGVAGVVNVATVQSTDDNVGGTVLRYELVDSVNGLFSINQSTGVITFNGVVQDYETNPNLQSDQIGKYFAVQVRAKESGVGGLQSGTTTVKIYLTNVNEAPNTPTYTSNGTISETVGPGTVVGTLAGTDPDGTNPSFVFTDALNGSGGLISGDRAFRIAQVDGVWRVVVNDSTKIQVPEAGQTFRYNVKASDGLLESSPIEIAISVNDSTVNTEPQVPKLQGTALSLTEGVTGVVNVATVQSTDDGVGGTILRYELVDSVNGLFSINQSTGVITFNGAAQDYENNVNLQVENAGAVNERKYFEVLVRAKESGTGGLNSGTATVKIYLDDVNEAISDATYAPNVMSENAQHGAVVAATPTVVDPDTSLANRNFRYALVDKNGVLIQTPYNFAVDPTTGQITVGALGLPDVSTPTDVKVYVKISDKGGAGFSHTEEVTVRVNPVAGPQNQPPNSISLLSGGSVDELAAAGRSVATFMATDSDDNGGFVYSIVNSDGRFEFVGNELRVKDGYRLDHEQLKSHTVIVKVTDKNGSGLSHTQSFAIAVNDVNPETTSGSSSHDLFYGGASADLLNGSFGNDTIYGGFGADTLNGDADNDTLKGENDKDKINGGDGVDKIYGGYGNDTLWGGKGKDYFVFDAALGTSKTDRKVNFDTIKDYSVKDDSIWLENDLFKSNKKLYASIKKGTENKPLKMASKFFTVGDKAKDKDDYFVYDAKKRVLYYDADGSGSKSAIELATFTNNKALKNFTYKEFFFI